MVSTDTMASRCAAGAHGPGRTKCGKKDRFIQALTNDFRLASPKVSYEWFHNGTPGNHLEDLHLTSEQITGLPAWRLKRALAFIDLNLSGQIRLPLLAQAVGMSRMHFARLFRLSTGLCPHQYVMRRRVTRAKDLLVYSDESIADIAQASGFGTPAHFANVFHHFVGKPPSRWRRSMRATALESSNHNRSAGSADSFYDGTAASFGVFPKR
jgi:AraC-like DNA-binding protein